MLPLRKVVITDNDIDYAQQMLLAGQDGFDKERVDFIKRLTSLDLQACPGSGKTTCLLAKLLILDRYLPFEDNSGLLVLSHTNAAVDEIRRRIFKYSRHIFQYPNFIGTIQGFINQFLAVPFYIQEYRRHPHCIDEEIFRKQLWEPSQAKGWLNGQQDREEFLASLRFDQNGNLVQWVNGTTKKFPLTNKGSPTYQALLDMRWKVLKEGYLCFDDAYYLAERYINMFPSSVRWVQARFGVVFVDEMQDTDIHQLRMLSTLFPDTKVVIQRIGDQNQAIYGRVKSINVWQPRSDCLSINGSKRLSNVIATTIKNICVNPQVLVGNGKRNNIKPKIILFNDQTMGTVISRFGDLILENGLHKFDAPVFKAIGWVKEEKNEDGNRKLGITSYFPQYQVKAQSNKQDFDVLSGYLKSKNTEETDATGLMSLRKLILDALIKVLRHAHIVRSDNGRPHTVQSFLAYMREHHALQYEQLKLNLYKWSVALYQNVSVQDEIRVYFNELLLACFKLKGADIQSLRLFFDTTQTEQEEVNLSSGSNILHHVYSGSNVNHVGKVIDIKVGTIHSVKGETHTATLYLETCYYGHESQKIIDQLKGNVVTAKGVRLLETLKMAYVGMSRPTDLLCLAIHESRLRAADWPAVQVNWDILN